MGSGGESVVRANQKVRCAVCRAEIFANELDRGLYELVHRFSAVENLLLAFAAFGATKVQQRALETCQDGHRCYASFCTVAQRSNGARCKRGCDASGECLRVPCSDWFRD